LSSDIAEVSRIPDFTLKIGALVSRMVTALSGLATETEWPNDVLLEGRKLAGVLVETFKPFADGDKYVIIGIGLNLNQPTFPEPLSLVATSLFQVSGKTYPKWPFIAGLTQEIDRVFAGH
jgi:BirA family biotin operon repressor/biotin-[acetyl-CoA-carboxylase] ligase